MKRACKILTPKGMINSEQHVLPLKNNKYKHMKALKLIITVICLIFVTISSFAQPTKEQIKEAEEAQKKAMEMMQKNPMMKDIMKQIQAAESQRKVDNN